MSSYLTEIDPRQRSSHSAGRNADVSSIYFKAGRRSSVVELQWHPNEDLLKLSKDQRDDLSGWLSMDQG